jgi:tetratricopeptide (TPR) repeat protein
MSSRHLTVRERVLVHLSQYSRFSEEYECPGEMSQAGIALAIGKSRAHTTLELNRMKHAGLVTERLAHVKGTKSKRKTYTLAHEALAIEREITTHIEGLEVKLSGFKKRVLSGRQATEILMGELSISRAVAFDIISRSNGIIDLNEIKLQQTVHCTPIDEKTVSADSQHTLIQESQTFDAFIAQARLLSKKGRPNEALAVLDKGMETNPSSEDMTRAHYSRASILRKQGNFPLALEEINRSLRLADKLGKPLMAGRCQMEKAMILSSMGNETQSMELLDSADVIFRREDSQVDLMRCGINQGIILKNLGKISEAVDVLEMALDLAGRTGLEQQEAYAIVNLTDLLNYQGDHERSMELAQKARDIFQVHDEPIMLAAALFNLGVALAGLGEKEEAMSNLDNAISILEKNGLIASRINWLETYASVLEKLGEVEKARAVLHKL